MLAAMITAPGADKLEVRDDVEAIGFGPGTVRVAIRATSLCHSDISAMSGIIPSPMPLVLGHEGAGEVLEVGKGVTHVRPGDRVIVNWRPSCGECVCCAKGQGHLCQSGNAAITIPAFTSQGQSIFRFMGAGTFAQEVVLNAGFAAPIPEGISYDAAALIGCGVTTGVGAAFNTARIRAGDSVAVIGCGGVGISAVLGAKAAGASHIVAVDPVQSRRDWALSFGATEAVAPEELADAVARTTAGIGFDHVIEAVGRPLTFRSAYDATRRGGNVVLVGVGGTKDELPVRMFELTANEKRVLPSFYGGDTVTRTYARIADLVRTGRLDLEQMITHRLPLTEVNQALDLMRSGEALRISLTV